MEAGAHGAGWSLGVVCGLIALAALLTAYLLAARARTRRRHWSRSRTVCFAFGVAVAAVAVLPTPALHDTFRGHTVQHLLLGMFAPLALVVGAPGTLLLATLPKRAARRTVRVLATRPVRALIHPSTAAVLDIGGMYLLYLTPLYALSQNHPLWHALMHVHFLIAGYLFTWSIAGPDPAPHRPSMPTRLLVLFVAAGAHATLAKLMYGYGFPRGVPHTAEDLQAGAQLMYYGGDGAEIMLAVLFFAAWSRRGFRWRHAPVTAGGSEAPRAHAPGIRLPRAAGRSQH